MIDSMISLDNEVLIIQFVIGEKKDPNLLREEIFPKNRFFNL